LPALRVLEVHYLGMRPVKMVSDEGYLTDQLVDGVA
jgi:hypothetical protein